MKYFLLVVLISACGGDTAVTPDLGEPARDTTTDVVLESDSVLPDTSTDLPEILDDSAPELDSSPEQDSPVELDASPEPDTMRPDTTRLDTLQPDTTVDAGTPDLMVPDTGVDSSTPPAWKVLVRGGTHIMGQLPGSECQQPGADPVEGDSVQIKNFWVMSREMTIQEWRDLGGPNVLYPNSWVDCPSCPVNDMTWHEAAAACNALSMDEGKALCYQCQGDQINAAKCSPAHVDITQCKGYRLLTRAEWEYAYRAGSTTEFYHDSVSLNCVGSSPAQAIGWYRWNSGSETHAVGQKAPNAWGLYDMAGNVEEWVHDDFSPTEKYLMGGHWNSISSQVQAGAYSTASPTTSALFGGVRCALTF